MNFFNTITQRHTLTPRSSLKLQSCSIKVNEVLKPHLRAQEQQLLREGRARILPHQGLLVLHQADYLDRLFLQVVVQILRQWRQHRVKVLLGHCVVG